MASSNKDTIYIDVDDEITGIIDKVKGSNQKIVALVLPKRTVALQSIVNMKLLKRSAQKSKKSLVLITNEGNLLPLAGAVGLHVAKTLQSKPAIPPIPERGDSSAEIDESDGSAAAAAYKPVPPPKAAVAGAAMAAASDDDTETIELDTQEEADAKGAASAGAAAGVGATAAKMRKRFIPGSLRVPNFEKFRLRFFVGIGLLIVLIIGWFMAFVVMPKAQVTIKTDSTAVTSSIQLTASTTATTFDADQKIVPAVLKEVKKSDTEKTAATGEKDVGTKATGTMTIYNCPDDNQDVTVTAGTAFSTSGFTYVTDQDVSVPASGFNSPGSGGACKKDKSASVPVTAQNPGDKYNLSAGRDYSTSGTGLSGKGSAMSGGTSKIIKVVSKQDVDGARDRLRGRQKTQAVDELNSQLGGEGLFALKDTLLESEPAVTAVPAVNEEAGEVTVTAVTTYTILGVKEENLSELVKKEVETKIDKSKQTILDDGVKAATFRVDTRTKPEEALLTMQALTEAGPQLDTQAIKDDIRGKKRGEAERLITARPGIEDVTIEYSPFWVFSMPKAAKKITVTFEKPVPAEQTQSSDDD